MKPGLSSPVPETSSTTLITQRLSFRLVSLAVRVSLRLEGSSSQHVARVCPSLMLSRDSTDVNSNHSCRCYRCSMECPFRDPGRRRNVGFIRPPRRYSWIRAPTAPVPGDRRRKPPVLRRVFGRPPYLQIQCLLRRNLDLARRPRCRDPAR